MRHVTHDSHDLTLILSPRRVSVGLAGVVCARGTRRWRERTGEAEHAGEDVDPEIRGHVVPAGVGISVNARISNNHAT